LIQATRCISRPDYAQFKAFHQPITILQFISFYGDDDPEERLRYLDSWLQDFQAAHVDSAIPLQPLFTQPKKLEFPYSVSQEDEQADSRKAMFTTNWVLVENTDPQLSMGLDILAYILIGTPASPLRKALIDSGLGEDLAGGGYDDDTRQSIFSTGLKGIALEDAGKVEQLLGHWRR
jgi:Zn-dependent M16 (insulinase) family peptidase